MSNLTILGDTSGSVVLQAPAIAGSTTITMPAATGTMMVSGNMPAFSAWVGGGNQSLTTATWTKITFNTEEFDTASCFNTSTYRFTPNVAGYYQVNLMAYQAAGGTTNLTASIYKNGSAFKTNQLVVSTYQNVVTTALIYLNGSTDYIEAYANSSGATGSIISSPEYTYFQAYLARSA